MSKAEIKRAILDNAQIKLLAEAGRDADVAEALKTVLPKVARSTPVNWKTFVKLWGWERAAQIRTALAEQAKSDEVADMINHLFSNGTGIDVGDDQESLAVGAMVAASVLTADEGKQLIATSKVRQTVSASDVSDALSNYRTNGKAGVINGE